MPRDALFPLCYRGLTDFCSGVPEALSQFDRRAQLFCSKLEPSFIPGRHRCSDQGLQRLGETLLRSHQQLTPRLHGIGQLASAQVQGHEGPQVYPLQVEHVRLDRAPQYLRGLVGQLDHILEAVVLPSQPGEACFGWGYEVGVGGYPARRDSLRG